MLSHEFKTPNYVNLRKTGFHHSVAVVFSHQLNLGEVAM